MASALALMYSTIWAMKTNTLEAGQFVEFILTSETGMKYGDDVNYRNTNFKWRYDLSSIERKFNGNLENQRTLYIQIIDPCFSR